MVRGDERYARSTKTFLTLGEYDEGVYFFDLEVSVNVLRDIGEGQIVFYDNDLPAEMKVVNQGVTSYIPAVIDWSSLDNEATIVLSRLNYDIEHKIYAEYIGNNHCQRSKSNIKTITVIDTNKAEATLTIDNTTLQYRVNTSLTKTITLSNDISEAYNSSQDIIIYYDDNKINTITTGENTSTATITISDVGQSGLHTIRAEFEGSNHLTSATVTQNISVGYNLQIIDYPSLLIYDNTGSIPFNVSDWLGNPLVGSDIRLTEIVGDHDFVKYHSETDSDGNGCWEGNFQWATVSSSTLYPTLKGKGNVPDVSGEYFYSDPFKIRFIRPSEGDVTISSTYPRLYKNEPNILTIDTNHAIANAPVILTGDVSETLYTDSNGVATKIITGSGGLPRTINAAYGNQSASITLYDWIYWWRKNNNEEYPSFNKHGFITDGMDLLNLQDYYRLRHSSNNRDGYLTVTGLNNSNDYHFDIAGINSNNSVQIVYMSGNGEDPIILSPKVQINAKMEIERVNGTVTFRVKTQEGTVANQNDCNPRIAFIDQGTNMTLYLDFTNLTLRRI